MTDENLNSWALYALFNAMPEEDFSRICIVLVAKEDGVIPESKDHPHLGLKRLERVKMFHLHLHNFFFFLETSTSTYKCSETTNTQFAGSLQL